MRTNWLLAPPAGRRAGHYAGITLGAFLALASESKATAEGRSLELEPAANVECASVSGELHHLILETRDEPSANPERARNRLLELRLWSVGRSRGDARELLWQSFMEYVQGYPLPQYRHSLGCSVDGAGVYVIATTTWLKRVTINLYSVPLEPTTRPTLVSFQEADAQDSPPLSLPSRLARASIGPLHFLDTQARVSRLKVLAGKQYLEVVPESLRGQASYFHLSSDEKRIERLAASEVPPGVRDERLRAAGTADLINSMRLGTCECRKPDGAVEQFEVWRAEYSGPREQSPPAGMRTTVTLERLHVEKSSGRDLLWLWQSPRFVDPYPAPVGACACGSEGKSVTVVLLTGDGDRNVMFEFEVPRAREPIADLRATDYVPWEWLIGLESGRETERQDDLVRGALANFRLEMEPLEGGCIQISVLRSDAVGERTKFLYRPRLAGEQWRECEGQ